jgi:hypothetical protein
MRLNVRRGGVNELRGERGEGAKWKGGGGGSRSEGGGGQ